MPIYGALCLEGGLRRPFTTKVPLYASVLDDFRLIGCVCFRRGPGGVYEAPGDHSVWLLWTQNPIWVERTQGRNEGGLRR
jgi:hypothetical protein